METVEERVQRLVAEDVAIAPYDPRWPEAFRQEKAHLLSCLPGDLVKRIEHFGSTGVPGLAAKPIIDMLVEVTDLQATRERIAPLLESQGYDYMWRPSHGDDGEPFYAWFIKRDPMTGLRTHHIHMVERGFVEHWNRLLFRDYLIAHPDVAREYEGLKRHLASTFANDRVAYTNAKSEFIAAVTARAMPRYRDDSTIRNARSEYFSRSSFASDGGYGDRWVQLKARGRTVFAFPNTAARIRSVKLHDIHHVLTGYETDWAGEAEIGAWELASGCARHYPAWILNAGATAIGILLWPRRVIAAFQRGRRSENLYRTEFSDELLDLTVGDLRRRLRLTSEPRA